MAALLLWLLLLTGSLVLWRFVVLIWIWTPFQLLQSCAKQKIGCWHLPQQGLTGFFTAQLPGRSPWVFRLGKTVRLTISDPAQVRDVMQTNADSYSKPFFIESLDVLGRGIFTSSGAAWSRQRELLAPAFHMKHLKPKLECIVGCTRSAIQHWDAEANNKPLEVDINKFFLRLTLNFIVRAGFGVDIEGDPELAETIVDSFDGYLHKTAEVVFGYAAAVPGYHELALTSLNFARAKHTRVLRSSMLKILQARPPSSSTAGAHSLLDTMFSTTPAGSDAAVQSDREQEVMDNCLTFLLAGHETTASLLTWTVYLLALHPLWQERARAEVEEFCQSGQLVDNQSIGRLKTVSMILLEALRLFPPQPVIGRRSLRDTRAGTYSVASGLEILIPVAAIHRDQQFWGSDSNEFRPARFANGIHGACKEPMAYLPFGTGPRTCLGQGLALLEAKAILAVILPRCSWRLSPSYRHSPDVTLTLQPKYEMPVILDLL